MLAPLLEVPLSEMLQGLDNLLSAKLEVSLAYAIHNVLWMYLRCKGTDAKEHPVSRELNRLKAYFKKIQEAENPSTSKPQLSLDKNAATRFINHALAVAQKLQEAESSSATGKEPYIAQDVVNPAVLTNAGKTTMLKWMSKDAKKVEDVARSGEEDEDSELEMVDGDVEEGRVVEEEGESVLAKPATPSPEKGQSSKREGKRPRQDPFTGNDGANGSSSQPSRKKRKNKKK